MFYNGHDCEVLIYILSYYLTYNTYVLKVKCSFKTLQTMVMEIHQCFWNSPLKLSAGWKSSLLLPITNAPPNEQQRQIKKNDGIIEKRQMRNNEVEWILLTAVWSEGYSLWRQKTVERMRRKWDEGGEGALCYSYAKDGLLELLGIYYPNCTICFLVIGKCCKAASTNIK